MGNNSPDLSQSRHRHVEFIFHALRGAMGIRTPDLLNAIEALYQLSYDPEKTKSYAKMLTPPRQTLGLPKRICVTILSI